MPAPHNETHLSVYFLGAPAAATRSKNTTRFFICVERQAAAKSVRPKPFPELGRPISRNASRKLPLPARPERALRQRDDGYRIPRGRRHVRLESFTQVRHHSSFANRRPRVAERRVSRGKTQDQDRSRPKARSNQRDAGENDERSDKRQDRKSKPRGHSIVRIPRDATHKHHGRNACYERQG